MSAPTVPVAKPKSSSDRDPVDPSYDTILHQKELSLRSELRRIVALRRQGFQIKTGFEGA